MKLGGQDCTWSAAEAVLFPCVPGQCLCLLPVGRRSVASLATLGGTSTQVQACVCSVGKWRELLGRGRQAGTALARQPARNGPGSASPGLGWDAELHSWLFPWDLLNPLWGCGCRM